MMTEPYKSGSISTNYVNTNLAILCYEEPGGHLVSDTKEWACPEEVWERWSSIADCRMVWVLESKEQKVTLFL